LTLDTMLCCNQAPAQVLHWAPTILAALLLLLLRSALSSCKTGVAAGACSSGCCPAAASVLTAAIPAAAADYDLRRFCRCRLRRVCRQAGLQAAERRTYCIWCRTGCCKGFHAAKACYHS
jgi:hypothetical protein